MWGKIFPPHHFTAINLPPPHNSLEGRKANERKL